jgi:hypothetical protein
MFIAVLLPEPLGPMMATNSPACDVQVDALERHQLGRAAAVALGDAAQADQRLAHGGRALLVGDHLHADLQFATGDLGHAPSLMPGVTATATGHAVAQHPDLRAPAVLAPAAAERLRGCAAGPRQQAEVMPFLAG